MTHLIRLDDLVFVSPQIPAEDMAELARHGVALVVSHRPDEEEPGQPSFRELEAAARDAGLRLIHAPVRGLPDDDAVAATAQALADASPDRAVLLFCRSGMRSAAAWAMARARQGADSQALRAAAADAGYDLSRVPL